MESVINWSNDEVQAQAQAHPPTQLPPAPGKTLLLCHSVKQSQI